MNNNNNNKDDNDHLTNRIITRTYRFHTIATHIKVYQINEKNKQTKTLTIKDGSNPSLIIATQS